VEGPKAKESLFEVHAKTVIDKQDQPKDEVQELLKEEKGIVENLTQHKSKRSCDWDV
jgi:hypothetical protein